MHVELKTDDLLHMVHSVSPTFEQQDEANMKALGRWSNAFDRWIWDNDKLANLTDEELFNLYVTCKR